MNILLPYFVRLHSRIFAQLLKVKMGKQRVNVIEIGILTTWLISVLLMINSVTIFVAKCFTREEVRIIIHIPKMAKMIKTKELSLYIPMTGFIWTIIDYLLVQKKQLQ